MLHPLGVSALQSEACTIPPFDAGLVQPGNEEMISLSAAAVAAQAVMTHGCAFSGGRVPYNGSPCLNLKNKKSHHHQSTYSFFSSMRNRLRPNCSAFMCTKICGVSGFSVFA